MQLLSQQPRVNPVSERITDPQMIDTRHYTPNFSKKEFLSILRGVRFLLTQWDVQVNSILHCVIYSVRQHVFHKNQRRCSISDTHQETRRSVIMGKLWPWLNNLMQDIQAKKKTLTHTQRQISKGHSLGNTYVWVMQIQGVHINIIFTQRAQVISNTLLTVNYRSHKRPQKISALGTARQARSDLAVTSSGPRLHLDSKSALDLAIFLSCPNERNGTNLLEAGQQTSTMLHTLPGSPASSLPSTSSP